MFKKSHSPHLKSNLCEHDDKVAQSSKTYATKQLRNLLGLMEAGKATSSQKKDKSVNVSETQLEHVKAVEILPLLSEQSLYVEQLEKENDKLKSQLELVSDRLANTVEENSSLYGELQNATVRNIQEIATLSPASKRKAMDDSNLQSNNSIAAHRHQQQMLYIERLKRDIQQLKQTLSDQAKRTTVDGVEASAKDAVSEAEVRKVCRQRDELVETTLKLRAERDGAAQDVEDAQRRAQQARQQFEELTLQRDQATADNRRLIEQNELLSAQVNDTNERWREEVAKLSDAMTEKHRSTVESKDEQIQQLGEALTIAQQRVLKLKTHQTKTQTLLSRMRSELNETELRLAESAALLTTETARSTMQRDEALSELDGVRMALKHEKQHREKIEKQLSEHIITLRESLEKTCVEAETAKKQQVDLTLRVNEYQKELASIRQSSDALEKSTQEQVNQLEESKARYEVDAGKKLQLLTDANRDLTSVVEQQRLLITRLKTEYSQQTTRLADTAQHLQSENKRLREEKGELQRKSERLSDKLRMANTEIERNLASQNDLRRRLSRLDIEAADSAAQVISLLGTQQSRHRQQRALLDLPLDAVPQRGSSSPRKEATALVTSPQKRVDSRQKENSVQSEDDDVVLSDDSERRVMEGIDLTDL